VDVGWTVGVGVGATVGVGVAVGVGVGVGVAVGVAVGVGEGDGETVAVLPIANSGSVVLDNVIVKVCATGSSVVGKATKELFEGIYL
jgi:hypothetical protein